MGNHSRTLNVFIPRVKYRRKTRIYCGLFMPLKSIFDITTFTRNLYMNSFMYSQMKVMFLS